MRLILYREFTAVFYHKTWWYSSLLDGDIKRGTARAVADVREGGGEEGGRNTLEGHVGRSILKGGYPLGTFPDIQPIEDCATWPCRHSPQCFL
jgi:hypothetical protein